MSNPRLALGVLVALLTLTPVTSAQEWTQWRGPGRDGFVAEKSAPAPWPQQLQRIWRVEVGEGYSSPVVAGGRAFVHGRRDPEEIVAAINLADGKVVWEQKYQAAFKKNQYAVEMAKGPNATPLVVENRLFTLGVTGVLTAWDTATDFTEQVDPLRDVKGIQNDVGNRQKPVCLVTAPPPDVRRGSAPPPVLEKVNGAVPLVRAQPF